MRGGSRRARPAAALSARAFAWDHALLATLVHCSLPWREELVATPLPQVKTLGARDRLSLLAQFAAHQALLQFAGIADGDFDASEWAVVQKRGSDVRLVRVAARASDPTTAPPVLTLVQDLAELIGAELEILQQSWARADAIYADAFARVARDVAADLKWLRASACGAVLSPGEALHTLDGRFAYDDPRCIDAVIRFAQLTGAFTPIVFTGASPLERYSALGSYDATLHPNAVAERILASTSTSRHVFIVSNESAFDTGSREVVAILANARHGTWLTPREGAPLAPTRWFVIAPRLHARDALRGPFDDFVQSPAFGAYLTSGEIPITRTQLPTFTEPARSYLGALALLGRRIPRETAQRFLAQFLFHGDLADLTHDGVASIDDDAFVFASDAVRDEAARLIPIASRPSICRVAAAEADDRQATLLWLDAGDTERAVQCLDAATRGTAQQVIEAFRGVPSSIVTPALLSRYAHALIDCGRYRDARDVAPHDELVVARAERRMGDYQTALTRLERLEATFEVNLLRAEVLRLLDREHEAQELLHTLDGDSQRLTYERALHGADATIDDPYFSARAATYRALEQGDFLAARKAADAAHQRARLITEAIDASLDRVFSAFSAGEWDEARAIAVEALREVEETQGDRAAGGILFTLAFLAADDAQWAHASQRIARLRRFYASTNDAIRLEELQLLAAHLDFSRGRFADARRAAHAIWERRAHTRRFARRRR